MWPPENCRATVASRGREGERVLQRRSAVDLLRFGNELEGRRLRRPRYRGGHSPTLGIGEAPGGASAFPPSFSRASVILLRR